MMTRLLALTRFTPGSGQILSIGSVVWGFLSPFLNPRTWPALSLSVAIAFGWGWFKGKNFAEDRCNEGAQRVLVSKLQRDLQAIQEANRVEDLERTRLEEELEKTNAKVKDYEAQIRSSSRACPLDADDIKRLRDIRGGKKGN
jgi:hypothetical protein